MERGKVTYSCIGLAQVRGLETSGFDYLCASCSFAVFWLVKLVFFQLGKAGWTEKAKKKMDEYRKCLVNNQTIQSVLKSYRIFQGVVSGTKLSQNTIRISPKPPLLYVHSPFCYFSYIMLYFKNYLT